MLHIQNAVNRKLVAMQGMVRAARRKLREMKGSFLTENALVIVITVAIAGLVIAAMFAIFKTQLIPGLEDAVDKFFNFS